MTIFISSKIQNIYEIKQWKNHSGMMLLPGSLSCHLFHYFSLSLFLFLSLLFSLSIMYGKFDKSQLTLRMFQDHALGKPACILTGHMGSPYLSLITTITINMEASHTKITTLFLEPENIFLFLNTFSLL